MRSDTARLTALFLMSLLICGFGDTAYFANKEGNDLFAEGKYEEALKAYRNAQNDDPESKRVDFNLGATLYKLEKYADAEKAFTRSLQTDDPELQHKAAFNRGSALLSGGDQALQAKDMENAEKSLNGAVKQYKSLVRLHPEDDKARHNLELAYEKLKELEQKKKEEDQKQDNKEKNEEQKEDSDQKDSKDDQEKKDKEDSKKEEEKADKKRSGEEEKKKEKPGDISKEEAEKIFNAIESEERDLREKMKANVMPGQSPSGKDW